MYWIKRKFKQIQNVFKWLPIIWNQYDFDYHYALDAFKFKLQQQADFMKSNKTHTKSAKINSNKIQLAIDLMTKVYNEDYGCEYQNELKAIYGDDCLDFEFIPVENSTSYLMKWKMELHPNKKLVDQFKKDHDKLFKLSQLKQQKAHKLLWSFIEHNIQKWWD